MRPGPDVYKINDHILKIKSLLTEMESMARDFPALSRNSKRALASIKMLELNVSDMIAMDLVER
nr:hypothetical protein [Desulfobacula sp.]